jgi:hypothetical protein
MTGTHKVKMKVGDVEFEAEGTPAEVQAQCDRFMAAMRGTRPAAPAPSPKPAPQTEVMPKAESKPPEVAMTWLIKRFITEGVGKK